MTTSPPAFDMPRARALRWPGYLVGFAFGGFFDGILLHQILQWHHVLSGLGGPRDLRLDVLADGLFHGLMYLVAMLGLLLLWRARHDAGAPGAGRVVFGATFVGFGAWHILDAIVLHWILGLHRIRMDAADPLLWDLVWFFGFGVFIAALGIRLLRDGAGAAEVLRRGAPPLVLALALLGTGTLAALPPAGASSTTLVLFAPGSGSRSSFAVAAEIGARIVWSDPSGELLALELAPGSSAFDLYGRGALIVGSGTASGCLGWSLLPSGPEAASVPTDAI